MPRAGAKNAAASLVKKPAGRKKPLSPSAGIPQDPAENPVAAAGAPAAQRRNPKVGREDALRAAREEAERRTAELDAVFDSLVQPVIVFDATGKPVKANPAACNAFGLDMTRFDAKGYLKLLARFAARSADGRRVHEDQLPVMRALRGETVSGELYAFTNARGEALTFDVSATPLCAAGKITGAVAVWYDVTVRRQMEEALRERELMFKRLIDSNIIGIIAGTNDVVEEANDIVLYMLGYSGAALREGGINLGEITPPEYERLDRRAMLELTDYGACIPYEKEFIRKDGRRVAVLIGSALLDRSASRWISFVLDLTERRRMEKALEFRTAELERINRELEASYRDLESFSYSASHDLRSPLIAIGGFCRILLEHYSGTLDAKGVDLLRRIRDNESRMEQLIDDIFAFSRVGTRDIRNSEVDMEGLAKSVYEELSSLSAGRRSLHFEAKSLPPAHGDLSMLRQVFRNLLSNAVKFSEPRDVAMIEVGGYSDGEENIYYVRDNGIGFSMEHYHRLFGLFQRLHGPEQFAGTGVGLAIIKRIVEKHGGRVWAEGEPDKGASFYFTLPQNPPEGTAE
jgi:PAS domain S-box-containing protein